MKVMRSYFVNTVTAVAVSLAAITAGPVPAAAKDDDLLKALAGIAAVAVFAGLLDQQRQNRATVTRTEPMPVQPLIPAWPDQSRADRVEDDFGWQDRRVEERRGPRLPGACALEFGNGPRPATYYAESCLRREGVAFALPQYCAQEIRSRDYAGRVFEAECLRDAGYRTERWR